MPSVPVMIRQRVAMPSSSSGISVGERVEDLVVERAALGRVRDREARDRLGGLVEQQLPGGPSSVVARGHYSRTTSVSPSLTAWPSST